VPGPLIQGPGLYLYKKDRELKKPLGFSLINKMGFPPIDPDNA
jgi:hypothetical protein